MRKIFIIVLCLAFCLGLSACDRTDTGATTGDAISASPVASFDTIENFNIALKKEPNQYMGKCVSVKGYMNKMVLGPNTYTCLEDILTPKDELRDPDSPRLNLFMADGVWLAVVDYGDYVEICGTVAIKDGEICLRDCSGTVITAIEEMK
jgi:hypothetical protein